MLSEEECNILLKLLMVQETLEVKQTKLRHQEGVIRAKKDGKYGGRKKIAVDKNLLKQIAKDFEKQKITEAEAMRRSGISSRSTFYRRLREIKEDSINT